MEREIEFLGVVDGVAGGNGKNWKTLEQKEGAAGCLVWGHNNSTGETFFFSLA